MANIIKPKRSNTAAKVPTTTELISGELGVNMADQKVYINNGTSIVQVGAGKLSALNDVTITTPSTGQSLSYNGTTWVNSSAGAGDVAGPTSATDNAITRFDGTTGKLIQNSLVTIDDTGNVSGINSITDPDTIGFNTAYATPLTAGKLGWDNTYNTLGFGMSGGNIIQHIGEDTYIYIKATAAITKGQVIMFTGSVGASGVLTGAPATGVTNGQYIVGVAAESIALNGFGYVQTFGELRNVNTSAFADGDILYYNSAVTGGFTTTFPTSGLIVTVAAVVNGGSVGGGIIQIRVTVTQRITASTGITVTQTNAGTTIANSGVTSVTGTAPVVSSGGATPAISMAAATTSVNGYLTSTDWNTFNGKQAALVSGTNIKTVNSTTLLGSGNLAVGTVTSVGGTGTVSGLTLTGTVTTSGNLTLGGNLTIAADMIYDTFTATASQTTFTSSTTYTSGKIDVYVNGVKMRNGSDVTVTSGTSVVFATGLAVGSLVDLVYPI